MNTQLGIDVPMQVAHRDITDWTINDDTNIINRTKNGSSPFVPIRKEPLISTVSNTPSNNSALFVEDLDTDTGWREVNTISDKYLLITNEQLRRLMFDVVEQSGLSFREDRIFWDGNRFCQVIEFPEVVFNVGTHDEICLALITTNSYNGSWPFRAMLMAKRFVCDNGLITGEFFSDVRFRHTTNNSAYQELVQQTFALLHEMPVELERFGDRLKQLQTVDLSQRVNMTSAFNMLMGLGQANALNILDNFYNKEPVGTAYGLLQAATNVLWHDEKMNHNNFTNNGKVTQGLIELFTN